MQYTMKLKHLLLTLILGLFAVSMPAEERGSGKATVIVDYFYAGSHVSRNDYGWIDMLRNDIIKELIGTGRVSVVDAASVSDLNYIPQGYNENSVTSRLRTLKSHGGRYVVLGDIEYVDIQRINTTNSRAVRSRDNSNNVYDARIGYNLRLIDIATGEILGQTIADPKDGSVRMSTPEKSMESVTGRAATEMRRILIDGIAITGQMLQVLDTKVKKGVEEAKTVALNVGSDNGAAAGVKFDVFTTRYIAGHKVSDKIGKVKITEVKGSDISYAIVKDGGSKILEAMRNGDKLTIKSSKAGFWD